MGNSFLCAFTRIIAKKEFQFGFFEKFLKFFISEEQQRRQPIENPCFLWHNKPIKCWK